MSSAGRELEALVRYSAWASKRLLDFAAGVPEADLRREIPNSHGGILKTFQHIFYADRVWLARLEQAPVMPGLDPAPGPSVADLDRSWWPLLDRLTAYAAAEDPAARLTFRLHSGAVHTLERGQIIRHVVNHATYHRGQVAAMLRQSGHTPPSTDLLYYELGAAHE